MERVSYAALSAARLREIVAHWPTARIAVVGDFFLDRYLIIDPGLTEPSIETGLDAYQVVEKRPQPGAAGTVTNNLAALGIGELLAVGVVGDDGEGYELRQGLAATGVDTERLSVLTESMTSTYTKPLVRAADGSLRELNRLDMRNREPIPSQAEDAIVAHIEAAASDCDAVLICDQEDVPELGVITPRVVAAINDIAAGAGECVFWVDSRGDIARFRNCTLKPNALEACRAAGIRHDGAPTLEQARAAGERLLEQTDARAVIVTVGADGVLVMAAEYQPFQVPAVAVEGPIDIVGAGDSFTAGAVAALTADASLTEAALVGNLVASITIQQLGTTGTASPEQLLQRLSDVHAGRVPGAP